MAGVRFQEFDSQDSTLFSDCLPELLRLQGHQVQSKFAPNPSSAECFPLSFERSVLRVFVEK